MGLKKHFIQLGNMIGMSYSTIVEKCGTESKSVSYKFSDEGLGTKKTWNSQFFSITLNFDKDNICRGIAEQDDKQGMKQLIVGAVVASCVVLVIILSFFTPSKEATATCNVCGRTWSAGDHGGNYMSIVKTNMCKNDYENYKAAQDWIDNN